METFAKTDLSSPDDSRRASQTSTDVEFSEPINEVIAEWRQDWQQRRQQDAHEIHLDKERVRRSGLFMAG